METSEMKTQRKVGLQSEELTNSIISAAIEVHRELGPGLLESAYEKCLAHEFQLRNMPYSTQVNLPLSYKGIDLDCGYRMDLVVDNQVVIELKCVDKILPIHEAQLLTYLRLANIRTGLIMNFHTKRLMDGSKRMVL